MKFTSGYWLMRKEITPLYAVEYADHRVSGTELAVYAPSKHIGDRGDALNLGMLTVYLSSPMENVIKISIRHFEGAAYRGPFAEVRQTDPQVQIEETDTETSEKSGIKKKDAEMKNRQEAVGDLFSESGSLPENGGAA